MFDCSLNPSFTAFTASHWLSLAAQLRYVPDGYADNEQHWKQCLEHGYDCVVPAGCVGVEHFIESNRAEYAHKEEAYGESNYFSDAYSHLFLSLLQFLFV